MNSATGKAILAVIVLGGLGIGYYLWQRGEAPPPPPPVEVPQAPVAAAPAPAPQIQHPIEQAQQAEPAPQGQAAPTLENSDGVVGEVLGRLFPRRSLQDLLVTQDFIRRVVVTVDNLPRLQVPINHLPVHRAPGAFLVNQDSAGMVMSADNAVRYMPYVELAEAVDSAPLVAAYVRLYPLFQKAYEELGYPSGYFNDRLVEVIDLLLATPEVAQPIRLEQPRVLYRFADPQLETLPVGQKIMLRLGPDNAAKIKAKLRDIRQRLVGRLPAHAAPRS